MATLEEKAQAMYTALVTPRLFGVFLGTLLSGVVLLQLVQFFSFSEKRSMRRAFDLSVVTVIGSSGAVLLALDWLTIYNTTITHRGDVMYAYIWRTLDYLEPPVICIMAASSQLWFMERAWRITGSSIFFAVITSALILLELSAAVGVSVVGVVHGRNPAYFSTLGTLLVVQNWTAATIDLVATGVLLWKVRELVNLNSSPLSSDSPVARVLRLTFMTGTLTSVTAIACGVLYETTWKYANYWIPFILVLPRLSAISCLVTINHRNQWRSTTSGIHPPNLDIKYPSTLYSPPPSPRKFEFNVDLHSPTLQLPVVGKDYRDTAPSIQFYDPPHVSEIGSLGDLERALRDFGKAPRVGIDPEVQTVLVCTVGVVQPSGQRTRPSLAGHRRGSSGITVVTERTCLVEDRRSISSA